MDFFSQKHSDALEQVENFNGQEEHKSKLSHELIGAAAAFEAAKAYQDHERKEGKPASHALAKELFAGFMGAAVDRLIETKGLDFIDREKAKHAGNKEIEENVTAAQFES